MITCDMVKVKAKSVTKVISIKTSYGRILRMRPLSAPAEFNVVLSARRADIQAIFPAQIFFVSRLSAPEAR